MVSGINALQGAFERVQERPSVDCSVQECKGWDDQWGRWDDLGEADPGWGDIG